MASADEAHRRAVPAPACDERGDWRSDFPILAARVHDRPLICLDNAATTQKPRCVIDRIAHFYAGENADVLGGARLYADARARIARAIGATAQELVFVPSTTVAISLVAHGWGREHVAPGDEIVVSALEHHANLVPWRELALATGATLRVVPLEADGSLRAEAFAQVLGTRTKLVAVAHVSNVLGTIAPIAGITAAAHRVGARVLVDGAQAVAHLDLDVRALGVDFYAFSAHKVFGPTGIGALYIRGDAIETMPCWLGAANVVERVSTSEIRYAPPPARFESGTPDIAGALGFAAALEYLQSVGLAAIQAHERELLAYASERLRRVSGLRLLGTAAEKVAIQSFVLDGERCGDVRDRLARAGIVLQAGRFSAHPLFDSLGLDAAVRLSIAFYNTRADIDALVDALADPTAAAATR